MNIYMMKLVASGAHEAIEAAMHKGNWAGNAEALDTAAHLQVALQIQREHLE